MDIVDARKYLRWLITPETEKELTLFKENNLVDDFIELNKRIDFNAAKRNRIRL